MSQSLLPSPLPTCPTRGEVPVGGIDSIQPQARLFTSPLVGEDGRGVPHALNSEVLPC